MFFVRQDARTFAEDNGLIFAEVSAKTGMAVNEVFMTIGESTTKCAKGFPMLFDFCTEFRVSTNKADLTYRYDLSVLRFLVILSNTECGVNEMARVIGALACFSPTVDS